MDLGSFFFNFVFWLRVAAPFKHIFLRFQNMHEFVFLLIMMQAYQGVNQYFQEFVGFPSNMLF